MFAFFESVEILRTHSMNYSCIWTKLVGTQAHSQLMLWSQGLFCCYWRNDYLIRKECHLASHLALNYQRFSVKKLTEMALKQTKLSRDLEWWVRIKHRSPRKFEWGIMNPVHLAKKKWFDKRRPYKMAVEISLRIQLKRT